ncbi:dTMP kinase [Candidatus Microgenomates bacterium]|nr:dTMP kinase [Candidatus Microgenomates bacterium]
MERNSGYFITLEGGEGCGKTSHVPGLADRLRERDLVVFPTREPGGTSIGEQIREVLHNMKNKEMHPRTETLLFQAARVQFVEEVLRPKIDLSEIVISDRYADSTLAYQGYGHRQDVQELLGIIIYATGGLVPDLTVLLDVDVEIGLARKRSSSEWNRLDDYPPEFHHRVNEGYLEMAKKDPDRWVVINANETKGRVFDNLVEVVETKLEKAGILKRQN